MTRKILLACSFCLSSLFLLAQTSTLRGTVVDGENNAPLADASVVLSQTGKFAVSGADGTFTIENVKDGSYALVVTRFGYLPFDMTVEVLPTAAPVTATLRRDVTNANNPDLPTITLEEAESEVEGPGEVANLLHANRDIFQTVSGIGWSYFRFRERGYDSEYFPLFLNNVSINDPETGYAVFGEFGGLNDVLRNRESSLGLEPADFAFSEIGGATRIDTRASVQRKQIRASYAVSNRTYRNRVMLTANTGLMPGGWAISASASRRWAQEGYFDGTPFDGYSYFLSVDKKFGRAHGLNLTFLGAPSLRGRIGDSFEEMYDIAGNHRYNPNWGYQDGEKRNAAMTHSNQPIGILRYDWNGDNGTTITAAAYGQAGERGSTRLEWFDAANPAPDYNRRLPSAISDPVLAQQWADELRASEDLRQLDWTSFYTANRNNLVSINNADGIAGNTVTGNRAHYIIEDQRADSKEFGVNAVLGQTMGQRSKIQAGVNYNWYRGENFKVVDDLLGADFFLDVDKYAQQDFPDNPRVADNDLRTPNNVVREGDVFGYNYDENIRKIGSWLQLQTNLNRWSFFVGGEVNVQQFWRTGKMQSGRYPDNSLGDSEKPSFNTYGAKAGATYKLNGRNYLYLNGFAGNRAPQMRDVYLSPRIRNTIVSDVEPSQVKSVEGGYHWRAPYYRARVTGYMTTFEGETEASLFYQQALGVFGTTVLTGVDRIHKGIEAAIEAKPFTAWTLSAAANLGDYHYTSRPLLYVTQDNTSELFVNGEQVYQKNFLVPRTPQTTGLFSVKYEGRRFWFASLTANYVDDLWFDYDRTRRTANYVATFEPNTPIWDLVLDQQKAPASFTLDFFGGKSWRIQRKYFLYLTVGVNNLLDNKDVIISGRDSYRSAYNDVADDERFYTTELTYAPGLNYFVSIAIRM